MRILVAHDSPDTGGGVEAYLSAVVPALTARGHEVLALHHWQARNATVWCNGMPSVCVEHLGLDAAVERLRDWQPDVCFSHNMGPLATERLLLDAWPVVKMMHGYFGTCISGHKMHAFPSMRVCHRAFGPVCLALYTPRRCGRLSPSAMVRGYRWATNQRALFGEYAAVIVASDHMRDEYARQGLDVKGLHVLPLFSTLCEGERREAAGEPAAVLFAGRMTSLKGGDVLIAAARHAARLLACPVPLIFVGDGPARAAWQALAQSTGVPAEFTGWIAQDRRPAVYSRAALVAVPSVWPEPFGLIGLEAASLGIPAVAFDVGGMRQWLDPARNGVLVDPASGSVGLGAAIAALVGDRSVLRRLGEQARVVADRMSRHAHVDRLENVLSEASGRQRRL